LKIKIEQFQSDMLYVSAYLLVNNDSKVCFHLPIDLKSGKVGSCLGFGKRKFTPLTTKVFKHWQNLKLHAWKKN